MGSSNLHCQICQQQQGLSLHDVGLGGPHAALLIRQLALVLMTCASAMVVALMCCCVLPGARVSVVVDAVEPLEQLAATAAAWGVSINVLVEINAGQDRYALVDSASMCVTVRALHAIRW